MTTIEHQIDRRGWPDGPWNDEPDRVEWRSHGFACLIVRNAMGALCGYVGVPDSHPLHGRDYSDVALTAHGGLTFSDSCHGPICHVPQPGEPDNVWWFGFDCSHALDVVPSLFAPQVDEFRNYKTLSWVREQVEDLACQLSDPLVCT